MAKTITKKYVFLEYLGSETQIEQLQNVDQIKLIVNISDDGSYYESWVRRYNPFFNPLKVLKTNNFYLIISEQENPNYILYEEEDAPSQEKIISNKMQFFEASNTFDIKTMKGRISRAYCVNEQGDGFVSWSKNNNDQFNSLLKFNQGETYLVINENNIEPYYAFSLFDKTSWETISEPYKSYLDQSADRWEKYIRFKTSTIALIKNQHLSWKGLYLDLNNYDEYNDQNSDAIAYCGIVDYVDLIESQPGVEFNSVSFYLGINTRFSSSFSSNDWINVLTHELGHALGIGIYWDADLQSIGSVPPVNNFLNGQSYSNANVAYNEIIGLTRPKVPLEEDGGAGTSSSHWEDDYRLSSYSGSEGLDYPGITNELMVGYYSAGSEFILSQLSINCLVDFGYEEIEPGNNEGVPVRSTNFRTLNQNMIKLNCNCKKHSRPRKIN